MYRAAHSHGKMGYLYVHAFYQFKGPIHSVLDCEGIFLKVNLYQLSNQERVFRFVHLRYYHDCYVFAYQNMRVMLTLRYDDSIGVYFIDLISVMLVNLRYRVSTTLKRTSCCAFQFKCHALTRLHGTIEEKSSFTSVLIYY